MKSPKSALLIHKSNILPFEHSFGPFCADEPFPSRLFCHAKAFSWFWRHLESTKRHLWQSAMPYPAFAMANGRIRRGNCPSNSAYSRNVLRTAKPLTGLPSLPRQSMRQDIHIVYLRFNSDLAFSNCAFTSSSSSLAAASSSSFSATASWIRRWSRWIGSSSGSLGCGWLSK